MRDRRRTQRRIAFTTSALIFVVSVVWMIAEPGFEPLIGFLGSVVPVTAFYLSGEETEEKQAERRARDLAKDRANMLTQVKNQQVDSVLDATLTEAIAADLKLSYTPDLLQNAFGTVRPDRPDTAIDSDADIRRLYSEAGGRLLITGEPGAGKTTTLLRLARALIPEAQRDADLPVPVVFTLAAWAEKREPLDAWMIGELRRRYYVPEETARTWVEGRDIVPLLDGLDEVPAQYRAACTQAINAYGRSLGTKLVVTSRSKEYAALVEADPANRLELVEGIRLKPLEQDQISAYLGKFGAELDDLRRALDEDTQLHELAQSPLLLNVMVLAYRGAAVEKLPPDATLDDRRRHLFATYIDRRFALRDIATQRSSEADTRRWLGWLAGKMYYGLSETMFYQAMNGWPGLEFSKREGGSFDGPGFTAKLFDITTFNIEDLHMSWLTQEQLLRRYRRNLPIIMSLVSGTIGMITFGVASSLTDSIVYGVTRGLVSGLIFGPILGLLVGLFPGGVESDDQVKAIDTLDRLSWSWKNARSGLGFGLMGGLFVGFSVGLPAWIAAQLAIGLAFLLALWIGLASMLTVTLENGLIQVDAPTRAHPNAGIQQSLRNGMIKAAVIGFTFGLAVGMPIGVLVAQTFGFVVGIVSGIGFGLAIGLQIGLTLRLFPGQPLNAVVRHVVLRRMLTNAGHMPWNYADFLTYACELRLLVPVGGGFRFIHNLLRDHFAEAYRKAQSPE